jgi:hypothetical protein
VVIPTIYVLIAAGETAAGEGIWGGEENFGCCQVRGIRVLMSIDWGVVMGDRYNYTCAPASRAGRYNAIVDYM